MCQTMYNAVQRQQIDTPIVLWKCFWCIISKEPGYLCGDHAVLQLTEKDFDPCTINLAPSAFVELVCNCGWIKRAKWYYIWIFFKLRWLLHTLMGVVAFESKSVTLPLKTFRSESNLFFRPIFFSSLIIWCLEWLAQGLCCSNTKIVATGHYPEIPSIYFTDHCIRCSF